MFVTPPTHLTTPSPFRPGSHSSALRSHLPLLLILSNCFFRAGSRTPSTSAELGPGSQPPSAKAPAPMPDLLGDLLDLGAPAPAAPAAPAAAPGGAPASVMDLLGELPDIMTYVIGYCEFQLDYSVGRGLGLHGLSI
jgi:hypothetical protein